MEWTEETISTLRSLWDQGLSTAEIGRRLFITKNAVVGKAHRLVLPARPSPIRKLAEGEVPRAPRERGPRRAVAGQAAPQGSEAPQGSDRHAPATAAALAGGRLWSEAVQADTRLRSPVRTAAPTAVLSTDAPSAHAPSVGATVTPIRPVRPPAAVENPRPLIGAEPRRRGLTCCWPLGEPGTKQFRFCGGEPLHGKPYCGEHAQLAYVKLRDRRDTVA